MYFAEIGYHIGKRLFIRGWFVVFFCSVVKPIFTANSENLVIARAQKIKKPGHSKKEMASIKGKRKADASCS